MQNEETQSLGKEQVLAIDGWSALTVAEQCLGAKEGPTLCF